MANNAINDEGWVADRLASLEPPAGWRPSAAAGLMRFQERERAARVRGRWRIATAAAILPGCGGVLALHSFRPQPAEIARPATPGSFKESGSSTAPIICEAYTDYECPHCALLYAETIPLLVA